MENNICPYFNKCGGCSYQDISYEEQISLKKERLKEIFNIDIEIIPSEKIYGYRNRVDIPITSEGIGFKKRGSWKEVIEIDECRLFGERAKECLRSLKNFIRFFNLSPWNLETHKGFLRYIILREGKFTNELMITLITNKGDLPEEVKHFFKADSIYWCVNEKITDISIGEIKRFWGKEFIKEEINGIKYLLNPYSFFQTNPFITKKLIEYVSNLVKGKILDAYCGIGTFSLYLAKRGFLVEGFDSDKQAIDMAKKNASLNNLSVNFFVEEDRKVSSFECDSLIVDPPRVGLHPKFLKKILILKPQKIVYVSCNPESLKRDLLLLEEIYKMKSIKAFDMFPQTPHIEVVCELERK
ncbi:MAG: 23S rRNA (uracil(1939)-C(5))-methyltransferase RlmD [Candidatus Pacearchaeota archaeon]